MRQESSDEATQSGRVRPPRFSVKEHHRFLGGTRYQFQLIAGNGEPLFTSEPYNSRTAALEGIETVRRLVPLATNILPETANTRRR